MITLDIPAPEFIERFQAGEIPPTARVVVTFDDIDVGTKDPAVALIENWLAQAPMDPSAIREAEEDLDQIQKALNTTREQAGARILYPDSKIS